MPGFQAYRIDTTYPHIHAELSSVPYGHVCRYPLEEIVLQHNRSERTSQHPRCEMVVLREFRKKGEMFEPSRFALLSDPLSGEWKEAILSRDPNAQPLLEANVTWLRSLESHFAEPAGPSKRQTARQLRTIVKAVPL